MEELGFDAVGNLYLELGGVRELMNHLFQPHRGGKNVATGDFYYWIKKGGHSRKWVKVQAQRIEDKFQVQQHSNPFMRALIRTELNDTRKKKPLSWGVWK